jgi:AraC-like DNA-binding protein
MHQSADLLSQSQLDNDAWIEFLRVMCGRYSGIAYANGFRDYTNFARKLRRRFGRSPAA